MLLDTAYYNSYLGDMTIVNPGWVVAALALNLLAGLLSIGGVALGQTVPPFPGNWEPGTNSGSSALSFPTLKSSRPDSYPTNATLKWQILLPGGDGHNFAALALAPDGTLFCANLTSTSGGGENSNWANSLWAIDPGLVDPAASEYPSPDMFAKWAVYFGGFGAGTTPAVTLTGTVVTSLGLGCIGALDVEGGELVWSVSFVEGLMGGMIWAEPSADDNSDTVFFPIGSRIFAVTNAPGFVSFHHETNYTPFLSWVDTYALTNVAVRWTFTFPKTNPIARVSWDNMEFYQSSLTLGKSGLLYVNSQGGQIFAIDTTNGNLAWITVTNGSLASAPIEGTDGTIYYSCGGSLLAVNPSATTSNGVMGFKWRLTGATNSLGQVVEYFENAPVLMAGGILLVDSEGFEGAEAVGWVSALDSRTGERIWKNEIFRDSSVVQPDGKRCAIAVASDGQIYVTSPTGAFYSFGPDGKTNWVYETGGVLGTPLIGPDGTVFVSTAYGPRYVYAFDGRTGPDCSVWPQHRRNTRKTSAMPQLHLGLPMFSSHGATMNISGVSNLPVCLCATQDFLTWTNLGQLVLTNGTGAFSDRHATNLDARFYFAKPQ